MMSVSHFQFAQGETKGFQLRAREFFPAKSEKFHPSRVLIPRPDAPPCVPREQNAFTEMDFKTRLHSEKARLRDFQR